MDIEKEFTPKTFLGRKLLALRNKAIRNGVQLLTEEEILEEIQRRRTGEEVAVKTHKT